MTTTMRFLCGLAAMALVAGCQQARVYGPSDIQPSKSILSSIGQSEPTSPAPIASPEPSPVETVVLSPEYSTIDRSVPTVAVSDAAPIYLDSSEGLGTDVYALQQPAPAVSYEEAPAVAYFEDSPVAVKPRQIEETYVAAEPISEPLPAPLFVEEIVEQPILAAVSPAQQGFTQEPSEALEIEVNVPTSLEGIAPPPIVEANSIPAPAIREGALDAPVLPSTEIIESELAPIVSEAAAPPRPAFTPIPQPGLSSYGSAF